ncbi:phosphoglycolate phosphatase [Halorhodospira neutriphila]|uniref:Phosphoglycolate phosphatase n=1 Tax=Halorhodospira neutriphila TaxID=168379 RepID=A0ABS1E4P1_9GAMM|nr:phosphoglycolate phosphatase [Halorhodospira neutriphila]MBK1726708.1 phosphoglycolate phosphatase [Halorhodospira neutriphila]
MDLSKTRTVLFDLDGTLVDSAPDLTVAVNRMLAERGAEGVTLEQVHGWVGNGTRKLVARALTGRDDGEPPAAELDEALARFLELYSERLFVDSRAYPGAVEGVQALAAAGLHLAVVTNKPRALAAPVIEALGLAEAVPVVVGGDCCAARKPDPAPLLGALEALAMPRAGSLMVGDSAIDVATARAAGIPVVCVPYGYRRGVALADLGADATVERLTELPPLLRVAA